MSVEARLAMHILPLLWVAMSVAGALITVPVMLMRRQIVGDLTSRTRPSPSQERQLSLARSVAVGVELRLFVLLTFVLFGVAGLGIFPQLAVRIALTMLFFADNVALGYKSVVDYRAARALGVRPPFWPR